MPLPNCFCNDFLEVLTDNLENLTIFLSMDYRAISVDSSIENFINKSKKGLIRKLSWFIPNLPIPEGGTLVILDDDQSTHDVWQRRFNHELVDKNIRLLHFYHPRALIEYNLAGLYKPYYVINYEYIGNKENGLEVIEQLKIGSNASLVTSHYEEEAIRIRAQQLRIPIIPKSYATRIPLIIIPYQVDLILITNQPVLLEAWKLQAKLHNKKILAFQYSNISQQVLQCVNKAVPIYIDSNLGKDQKGEDLAKLLYRQGFLNIYLCTEYQEQYFEPMYWIKAIVSQKPPFV